MKPSRLTLLVLSLTTLTSLVGCAGGSPEQAVDQGALVEEDERSFKATEGATFVVNSAANTFSVVVPNEQGEVETLFVSVRIEGDLSEAISKVREEAQAGLAEFEPGRRCRSRDGEVVGGFLIGQAPNDRGFRYGLIRSEARHGVALDPSAPNAARLFWGQSAAPFRTCDEALEGAKSFAEVIRAMSAGG